MIRIRNLRKRFNDHEVLRGINLDIFDGETLAILGRSGAGKTVLLKHIVGLIHPDEGEIVIDDVDITKVSRQDIYKLRVRFGYVFQASALFDSMTVFQNVALPLIERGNIKKEEIEDKVEAALKLVGMSGTAHLLPAELSGGMKKRVGVARAIVTEPHYLLYDEPTAGLDPVMADKINDLILELRKNLKTTGIVVTHDIRSAIKVSDRIVLLADGCVSVEARGEEVFRIQNPQLEEFLRSSGVG